MQAILKQIYSKSGIGGFYSGIKYDFVRILPMNIVVFTSYEFIKKYLIT